MRLVYIASPYGGLPANLDRAERWLAWAWRNHFPRHGFMAPWIQACRAIPETAVNREAGLELCFRLVALADEFWMVGGSISDGMRREMARANVVRDLTCLGSEPPSDPETRSVPLKHGILTVTDAARFDPTLPPDPAKPIGTPSEWGTV